MSITEFTVHNADLRVLHNLDKNILSNYVTMEAYNKSSLLSSRTPTKY